MYNLEDLRERLSHGKQTVECYESYEGVNVRGLIDDSVGYSEPSRDMPPESGENVNVTVNVDRRQAYSGSGDNVGNNKNTQNS